MTDALVVGGGPSILANMKEMDRLDGFPGVIIVCDNSVERMMEADYRKFWAATLEDTPDLDKYYVPKIVQEHGHEILGGFIADRVHNNVSTAMGKAGMNPVKVPECKGYITSNVGLYCWLIATQKFKADRVYMIGMDCCYAPGKGPKIDKNSDNPAERRLYELAVQELVNPYDGETLILTPELQLWHEEFLWYCKKFPNVETINCSGRGAHYDKTFTWKPISQLKNWSDI